MTLLYEGRQIYFGRTNEAKQFFVNLGYECPERQTTADFLTSLTSPGERIVRRGFENKVPRTPDEFVAAWKSSDDYARLRQEMDEYDQKNPIGGESVQRFKEGQAAKKAKSQ